MDFISFHASTVLITGSGASVASRTLLSFATFQASSAPRRTSFLRPRQMAGIGFTPESREAAVAFHQSSINDLLTAVTNRHIAGSPVVKLFRIIC